MRMTNRFVREDQARAFCDYLLAQGIESEVRSGDGVYELWVLDDDAIERVLEEAGKYDQNPQDPSFLEAGRAASAIRKQKEAERKWAQKNYVDARRKFLGSTSGGQAIITRWMIGASVMLTMAMMLFYRELFYSLAIVDPRYLLPTMESRWIALGDTVAGGEVWRLITPIFLHGGWIHLLFNMLWLYQLGQVIEWRGGSRSLIGLTLGTGIPSNILQYILVGPQFLGMSGVVYGLLGYLWARERFGRSYGVAINSSTMTFMVGWLVLGFVMPGMRMANWAHLGGLVMGVLLGLSASAREQRPTR